MELNYAANPAGVRRCAGLSFKFGYQQTEYHHHIISYGDVKYYFSCDLVHYGAGPPLLGACDLCLFLFKEIFLL